jgi:MoaA/NifB/PqqE/SkfB family radical SAM enzyme
MPVPATRNVVVDAANFLRSYFSGRPSYLIFFITAVCNARCKHCFYWAEIESANARLELRLEEIVKIARSLKPLIYLSIGGGEPFLRPDLTQVVEAYYENSSLQYLNIVTNGFYTERVLKTVEALLLSCPRLKIKIQVSIDDFEKAHDEYRAVPGIYRKALETIRQLSERFRSKEPRFTLDVATCITKSNKAHVTELHDQLRRELRFDNYQLLYPRGNAEVAAEKDVTPAEYEVAVELLERHDFHRNNNPILSAVNRAARRGILDFLKEDKHPWNCLAGTKFASITERGVLQPCEVLHQMVPGHDSDLGDLRQFDFNVAAALDGQKARKVVDYIRETKCRCSFECASNCNVVFAKKNAVAVLKDWLVGKTNRRAG